MLELHQFRHSPYCLKVRMALAAKKLEYRTVEITPAIGQIDIFQKTGQRKLPVLFDKETTIHDSSLIIRHLEKIEIEPKLIPEGPKEASQAQIIENWADTTLAKSIKIVFLEELSKNPRLIPSLFANEISDSMQKVLFNIPTNFASQISRLINQKEKESLKSNLEYLSNLIVQESFLFGGKLSIADISVASHLSLLKFPSSSGEKLAGKGCSLYLNDPSLQNLFKWRDLIEDQLEITNHH
ncbi:glutathione S-transferase family protein [Prochlorococcus marinus]|uniref:Glutathione S-transferase n=1 Tax=Prochlorococcus marinus XMU1408 TaxID=2213228 RepID=A0A318R7L2_PROMR|nr:glutathione S-transferase family protein [Prochlorococcus marinus]MBW3041173.1 glutathione S-transferase [Prochlorococcus marinus str. XMU1408]PYE03771.1 glutathione S-transferase [Prochlorococcus marinus XMU1408]